MFIISIAFYLKDFHEFVLSTDKIVMNAENLDNKKGRPLVAE